MIGILNYGMGNLRSVANALSFLGIDFFIISKKEEIGRARKLILPGVGAFGAGMKNLADFGFLPVLQEEVMAKKKPILGICLGMQLFAEKGFEDGVHEGLGWIQGEVRKIEAQDLKVPHVGWNEAKPRMDSPLFEDIAPHSDFYFVHSFYLDCPSQFVSSTCEYGIEFPASVEWANIFGTQFHPEKSQDAGLALLRNFARQEMN
jgi:imidazole glycerol-phosphate synthase subunit HisH